MVAFAALAALAATTRARRAGKARSIAGEDALQVDASSSDSTAASSSLAAIGAVRAWSAWSSQQGPPDLPRQWSSLVRPRFIANGGVSTVWGYDVECIPWQPKVAVKAIDIVDRHTGVLEMARLREAQCEVFILDHFRGSCSFIEYYDSALHVESGKQLILMEAANMNLSELIRRSVYMSIASRLELFAELVGMVELMERDGFQHGDLKPHNVLVIKGPTATSLKVRLADLGLSCRLDAGGGPCARCASAAGTWLYRPPEAFSREGTRHDRQDSWSLGLVLFEMLFRTLPSALREASHSTLGSRLQAFRASDEPEVQLAVRQSDGAGQDAARLLVDMLALDPSERPSVADVRRRLLLAGVGARRRMHGLAARLPPLGAGELCKSWRGGSTRSTASSTSTLAVA